MRFFTAALVALSALVTFALADPNPIIYPTAGTVIKPQESVTITWTVSPGTGPISLVLREGPSGNLKDVVVIVSDINNSGSYTWVVPSDLTMGTDYAIEIKWSTGVNYSSQFTIDSSLKITTTTATTTSGSSAIPSGASYNATMSSGIYTSTDISSLPIYHTKNHTMNHTTTTTASDISSTVEPTTTKHKSHSNKTTSIPASTSASGSESSTAKHSPTNTVPQSGSAANTVSSVLALVIAGVWALAL